MLENFALSKEKIKAKLKHRYLWVTALGMLGFKRIYNLKRNDWLLWNKITANNQINGLAGVQGSKI